jgi:hypothetical protein
LSHRRRLAGSARRSNQLGGHDQPFLNLHNQRLDVWGLGTGLGRHTARAQRHTLQGRKAEDAGVGVAAERTGQGLKNEQGERFKTRTPRARTYILEQTRVLFAGRSDESCSRATHLAPTDSEAGSRRSADSGAVPLLPAGSRTALRSLGYSGAVLLTSAASEVGPWPPPAGRVLTVQNRAQVHRKPTGDLVPFSPRRVLLRFVNPRIGSKPLRFSI